jgi:hypothetical protein
MTMAAASTGSMSLSSSQGVLLLALVSAATLAAGLVVILGRTKVTGDPTAQGGSVIRSWIAISLVIGLLIFCAAAFLINDTSLRSTLFGGLVASVGAAVAFYFSSKTADQARTDILNAAVAMSQGATAPTAFSQLTPPAAQVNTAYAYRFVANGQPAPIYQLANGQLPAGLTLAADGTLQGTPTAANTYRFSIRATNSLGSFASPNLNVVVT